MEMTSVSLEEVYEEIKELKIELKRISALLEEDFELSEYAKKELREAREEPLSNYTSHKEVLKEFSK